jgi:cell division septal protein FtsQ
MWINNSKNNAGRTRRYGSFLPSRTRSRLRLRVWRVAAVLVGVLGVLGVLALPARPRSDDTVAS